MEIKDDVVFEVIIRQLDAIEADIKKVREELGSVHIIQARQAKDLEIHIKRTEINEENLSLLRKELEPARKITDFIKMGLSVIGAISLIAVTIGAVLKLFS